MVIQREDVEVISSHGQARKIHAGNRQVRILAQIFGKERLLDVARDADFLFQALAFAFALHEPRVVQDARCVGRQSVQDLPVQL